MATHPIDDGTGYALTVGSDSGWIEAGTLVAYEERDLLGLDFDGRWQCLGLRPLRSVQGGLATGSYQREYRIVNWGVPYRHCFH